VLFDGLSVVVVRGEVNVNDQLVSVVGMFAAVRSPLKPLIVVMVPLSNDHPGPPPIDHPDGESGYGTTL
jgi:hypothetical protein